MDSKLTKLIYLSTKAQIRFHWNLKASTSIGGTEMEVIDLNLNEILSEYTRISFEGKAEQALNLGGDGRLSREGSHQ